MKNYLFFTFFLLIFSCSKDDQMILNQVGEWEGTQTIRRTTDGVVTSEYTSEMKITFKENGEGVLDDGFFDPYEIHWVIDEVEKKMYVIKEYPLINGEAAVSTTRFTIEGNTETKQNWTSLTTNFGTGSSIVEYFVRWELTKIK